MASLDPNANSIDTETEFSQIDSRQISADRISGLILASIVGLGLLVGLIFAWFVIGLGWVWYSIAAAGVLVAGFLFWVGFFWPVLDYRRTSWRLSETGLEIHRGVIWRHRISIPAARVQHADVSQGPLQRRFELGKLTIHTAGTQNASVELDGLSHDKAIELRDQIVSQRKAADVV